MRRKKLNIVICITCLFICLICSSCGYSDNSLSADSNTRQEYNFVKAQAIPTESVSSDTINIDETSPIKNTSIKNVSTHGMKMVRTVELELRTKNYSDAIKYLYSYVEEFQGYFESKNENNHGKYKNIGVDIRIPEENLDDFINKISSSELYQVYELNENVEDKTLQYVNAEAKKEALEQELKNLYKLSDMADNVSDLLDIQDRIAMVQGDLDAYARQLMSIDSLVDCSTVNIYLSEVEEYEDIAPTFAKRLYNNFADMGEEFINMIVKLPMLIFRVFEAILILIICILLAKLCIYIWKLLKRENKKDNIAEESIILNETNKNIIEDKDINTKG